MRVVYFNRRSVVIAGSSFVIATLAIFMCIFCSKDDSVLAQPYYEGKKEGVAITINVDWGEDVLPQMLTVLEEKNVRATFFITGRFAEQHKELVQTIAEKGHEIGNHGYGHPHPDQLTVEQNEDDILKSEQILREILGKRTYLYAPPYGERGDNVLQAAEKHQYSVTLWTLDVIDWQTPVPSKETLVERASGEKLKDGAIILMHPKAHTLEALPEIIDRILARGYQIKPLSEIL